MGYNWVVSWSQYNVVTTLFAGCRPMYMYLPPMIPLHSDRIDAVSWDYVSLLCRPLLGTRYLIINSTFTITEGTTYAIRPIHAHHHLIGVENNCSV